MNGRTPREILDDEALIEILATARTLELPENRSKAILDATINDERRHRPVYRFTRPARWLAAASVLIAASIVGYVSMAPPGPSQAEAEEAARQLKLVFASTSRALRHAETQGVTHVFTQGVARATRHAPLLDAPEQPRLEH